MGPPSTNLRRRPSPCTGQPLRSQFTNRSQHTKAFHKLLHSTRHLQRTLIRHQKNLRTLLPANLPTLLQARPLTRHPANLLIRHQANLRILPPASPRTRHPANPPTPVLLPPIS